MTILDWIIIIIIVAFAIGGFLAGFIYEIGSFIGIIAGVWLAGIFSPALAESIGNGALWAQVLWFVVLFIVISKLISAVFWLINKVFNLVAVIPGLKFFNRVGGAIFGILEGAFYLGIVAYVIKASGVSELIYKWINDSALAWPLLAFGKLLSPLIPDVLKIIIS